MNAISFSPITERVIYTGYKVTIMGSIPVHSGSGATKLEFWIRGEIDKAAVRRNAQRRLQQDAGPSIVPEAA